MIKTFIGVLLFGIFIAFPPFFVLGSLGDKMKGTASPLLGSTTSVSALLMGLFFFLSGFIVVSISVAIYAVLVSILKGLASSLAGY
jgi:hypothetical protein